MNNEINTSEKAEVVEGTKVLTPEEQKVVLKKILWRSWKVGASYNNVRGQAHGCIYSLYPLFDKLYPNPEDAEKKKEAIKRHEVFYNISPQINTIGLGLFAALEERIAADPTFDKSTVNALKASIMGPASGIGDSIFQITIKLVAASIGIGLAQSGSPLGGILFFVIFNACSWAAHRYCMKLSYTTGIKLVSDATSSGIMKSLTSAATVIGLFMIGSMVASTVSLSFSLSWEAAGGTVTLQSFFDALMPKILPLASTLLVAKLLRNKVNANLIMVAIIILAILGKMVGLF